MINKAYYFGVGGSVEGFKEILLKFNELQVVDELIINNKKSNKKVILVIQRTIHWVNKYIFIPFIINKKLNS